VVTNALESPEVRAAVASAAPTGAEAITPDSSFCAGLGCLDPTPPISLAEIGRLVDAVKWRAQPDSAWALTLPGLLD